MNLVPVLVILTSVLEILSPVEGHSLGDFGVCLGDVVHPLEYLEHGRGNLGRGLSLKMIATTLYSQSVNLV